MQCPLAQQWGTRPGYRAVRARWEVLVQALAVCIGDVSSVWVSDFSQERPGTDAILSEALSAKEELRKAAAQSGAFPPKTASIVEPYHTNLISKLLAVVAAFLSLPYLAYIWCHRRQGMLCFGTFFFMGEVSNVILGFINRAVMWHRQVRHVCRLDALTPPFPKSEWPKVHILFTHFAEPVQDSEEPLRCALLLDYPVELLAVHLLDDGYYKRVDGKDCWEVTRPQEHASTTD